MAGAQRHIIRREVLEVDLIGSEGEALALQRRLADLCRDRLAPQLEAAFATMVPEREHWVIERLAVDAGAFTLDTLEASFVDAVAGAVEQQIRELAAGSAAPLERTSVIAAGFTDTAAALASPAGRPDEVARRDEAEAAFAALVHFLSTGALPWWFDVGPLATLEGRLRAAWSDPGIFARYARATVAAASTPTMRLRLARQLSPAFLADLLSAVVPQSVRAVRELLEAPVSQGTSATAARIAEGLWQIAILAARAEGAAAREEAMRALEALRAAHLTSQALDAAIRTLLETMRPREQRTAASSEPPELDLGEGIFVACAGLVLLHPFLPQLFASLGIANDDRLIEPDRAMRLMHYLASGEREAAEHVLVLPKMLCGLEPGTPAEAPGAVTAAEAAEADALLEAVIAHWDALGRTSVDALRGTFLVRSGKLSRRGEDDVLQVEQQSFDVLMDRLPWGISAVRLPWMSRILWVEWTS